MVCEKAPELMTSHGISTLTVAEMLILVGDNPERIKSEAAFPITERLDATLPAFTYRHHFEGPRSEDSHIPNAIPGRCRGCPPSVPLQTLRLL